VRHFAQLYTTLDGTNKTNEKVAALIDYFNAADPESAAWATYLLCGRKIRQIIAIRRLCEWAIEEAGLAPWLFEECYEAVGDLAETICLVLPPSTSQSATSLSECIEQQLVPLRDAPETDQRSAMVRFWRTLSADQCFVLHKLITGAFRVGVSRRLVTRALARVTGIHTEVIAHRLMGDWQPSAQFFRRLTDAETAQADCSQPYPFFLAHPLQCGPSELGDRAAWQAEWKWDGIRAQLVRRGGETLIWSRGEELMTDRFPEIATAAELIPDGTVLDGEVLAWNEGVLPFSVMQKRIGRKKLGKTILAEAPVALMAFDLLEHEGKDVREQPLQWRRERLEAAVRQIDQAHSNQQSLLLSPIVQAGTWDQLAEIRQTSREENTEGLMLKRLDSPYGVGRPRGDWWKWKIDPFSVDAVLIYAQRGSGRRASLYTDYTFAVWHGEDLVPFAKAYSGLSNDEIAEVDAFVRGNTVERFGPVRSVTPKLVFEIAFENIQLSKRHKSGIAVRFPRIVRWRRDKSPRDADSLANLKSLIPQ
jgi:DNA ligase-1